MESLFTTAEGPDIREMTQAEASAFTSLLLSPDPTVFHSPSGVREHFAALLDGHAPTGHIGLFCRCLGLAPDLLFDPEMVLFLAGLCDRPAKVVLWAHSLVTATRLKGAAISVREFANLSPWGVPAEDFYKRLWESQKRPGGNWLDTSEAWAPLSAGGSS